MALLAGGACGPALTGALTSRLPGVVGAPSLPRAFGLDSLTYNVSGIAGPALAGVVSAAAAPASATLALAGLAASGAAVLARVRLAPSAPGHATEAPPLRAGALVLARDRVLGVVTGASALGQLGPGALPVVAAVLTERQGDPAATGWLLTSVAAGGLLGSLAWTWRPLAARRAPLVVTTSLAGVGAPLALAALAPSLPATAALFALSGFFLGPFTGALFLARQDHAPDRLRAQVFTIGAGLKTTAAAAGAALAGTVSGAATATQLLLVGACPIVAGAVGTLLLAVPRRSARASRSAARATAR